MTQPPESNVITLASGQERPPFGKAFRAASPRDWGAKNLRGTTPKQAVQILDKLRRGDMEDFQDLVAHMLQTDAHLRSVYETLLRSIVASPLRFDLGRGPGREESAEAAAEFARSSVENAKRFERTTMHLAHGAGTGVAVVEQHWGRVRGAWRVTGHTVIPPRDTRFADDWVVEVRSYEGEGRRRRDEKWIRTDAEPLRWIVHVPGSVGLAPHLSGLLLPCVWPYTLKRWATTYAIQTLERFAQPLLIAKLDENATDKTFRDMLKELQALANNSVGVISARAEVEVVNSQSGQAGTAHAQYIKEFEAQQTKALLGSTLNIEVGDTGGNRALGESQAEQTNLPRLRSIGDSLAETLSERWFNPEICLNTHLFNGQEPPLPEPYFELTQEEPPEVSDLAVDIGGVTVDEVRESLGLEPFGQDGGGSRRATRVHRASPSVAEAPRPRPTSDDEPAAGEGVAEAAAGVSLNGAQVASLLEIVSQVAQEQIPRETGLTLMTTAFPITRPLAEQIMGDIGLPDGFVPRDESEPLGEPSIESQEGAPPPLAASRPVPASQMSLPIGEKTSRTWSAWTTRAASVPFDKSGDHEKR